jgi:hypothetical protein
MARILGPRGQQFAAGTRLDSADCSDWPNVLSYLIFQLKSTRNFFLLHTQFYRMRLASFLPCIDNAREFGLETRTAYEKTVDIGLGG